MVKSELKTQRLRAVLRGEPFDTNAEVRKAFEKIEMDKIANCVCHVECLFKNV